MTERFSGLVLLPMHNHIDVNLNNIYKQVSFMNCAVLNFLNYIGAFKMFNLKNYYGNYAWMYALCTPINLESICTPPIPFPYPSFPLGCQNPVSGA